MERTLNKVSRYFWFYTDQAGHGLQTDNVVLEVSPVVERRGFHEVCRVPLISFQKVERVQIVPPVGSAKKISRDYQEKYTVKDEL